MSNVSGKDGAKPLFGCYWKNSRGETDGWGFQILDNKVVWTYNALFDAREHESSSGYAEFGREEFKNLLKEYFQSGFARYKENGGHEVTLKKSPDGTEVRVYPSYGTGVSSLIAVLSPDILKLF